MIAFQSPMKTSFHRESIAAQVRQWQTRILIKQQRHHEQSRLSNRKVAVCCLFLYEVQFTCANYKYITEARDWQLFGNIGKQL